MLVRDICKYFIMWTDRKQVVFSSLISINLLGYIDPNSIAMASGTTNNEQQIFKNPPLIS